MDSNVWTHRERKRGERRENEKEKHELQVLYFVVALVRSSIAPAVWRPCVSARHKHGRLIFIVRAIFFHFYSFAVPASFFFFLISSPTYRHSMEKIGETLQWQSSHWVWTGILLWLAFVYHHDISYNNTSARFYTCSYARSATSGKKTNREQCCY